MNQNLLSIGCAAGFGGARTDAALPILKACLRGRRRTTGRLLALKD